VTPGDSAPLLQRRQAISFVLAIDQQIGNLRQRMSIKEILEELPKLTPEERQEIRDFLDAEEFPESDDLIEAVDEGFRSSETEQSLSIEEVRTLIRQCATRSK
jgi:hypothetical protein